MNSNQVSPGQQQVGWLSLNHLLEVQPQHCLLGSQSNESWYLCNRWSENTKRKAMGNALVADLTKKHELTTVRQHTNSSKYQTMAGMRGVLFASDGGRGFCWSGGSIHNLIPSSVFHLWSFFSYWYLCRMSSLLAQPEICLDFYLVWYWLYNRSCCLDRLWISFAQLIPL